MIPHAEWKWYGYAGHLCVGKRCAYHLATRIGKYFISTLGHYIPGPRSEEMETIGAGPEAFFETFVFPCQGEDQNGDPIFDLSEVETMRYAKSIDAERGHYEFCQKYAEAQ